MFGVLASSPVAKLEITVIDPENRGTSVGPFFDARKRLPELFGEKICFTAEDIATQLALLNEEIETTLMDKLGTEYDSIFDYSREHPEETLRVPLPRDVVISLAISAISILTDVRNILRNGSRCGIYTVIDLPAAAARHTSGKLPADAADDTASNSGHQAGSAELFGARLAVALSSDAG